MTRTLKSIAIIGAALLVQSAAFAQDATTATSTDNLPKIKTPPKLLKKKKAKKVVHKKAAKPAASTATSTAAPAAK